MRSRQREGEIRKKIEKDRNRERKMTEIQEKNEK